MFETFDETSSGVYLAAARQHAQGSLQQVLEGDSSLLKRLKLDPVKDKDLRPLPVEFLRKYIAYSRQYANPRYQADMRTC